MFLPVSIHLGAGGERQALYDRTIELTSRQLAALEVRSRDLTAPLTVVGQDLRTQVGAAFATEGATTRHGRWTVLSPAYGQWKQQHAPGVPTLVGLRPTGAKGSRPQSYTAAGTMRRQLLDPLATYVSPQRMLYAPVSDIAGYHQSGTSRMPARPPVDLSLEFLHGIDRTFTRWLAGLIDSTGL